MNHDPVLSNEVVDFLRPARDEGTLVDATVGLGGHAEALLSRYPSIRLIAIDRDPRALGWARDRLERFGARVVFAEGRHEMLIDILRQLRTTEIAGLLADLGVSSMQLDDPERGFSFRFDAPLDMRMGPDSRLAAELVNGLDESELTRVLRDFGEEPMARRIARAIVERRAEGPTEKASQLR